MFVDSTKICASSEEEVESFDTCVRITCFETEVMKRGVEVVVDHVDLHLRRAQQKTEKRIVSQRCGDVERSVADAVAHIEFVGAESGGREQCFERCNVGTLHCFEHGSRSTEISLSTQQHTHIQATFDFVFRLLGRE
jgi:hypothetical protein